MNYIEILKSQERIDKISVHNALEQQNISTFLLKQIYFEILTIFRRVIFFTRTQALDKLEDS